MSRSLLIEIGVEELPASFVARAMDQMPALVRAALESARLTHGSIEALGTPRRLAVLVTDVAEAQPDLNEEVLGPPRAAAFEADGTPKKAAEGFAKKLGLDVSAVRIVSTDKGEYAAVTRSEKGQPATAVLAKVVEAATKITFPKAMRWGQGEVAFGRPVQWLVALFGSEVIDAGFAGKRTGRTTLGHRFLAPQPVEIAKADDYLEGLRKAHVLARTGERRAAMITALEAAAREIDAELVPDEFLVDENLTLVEEPHVVCGRFEDRFLALPEDVIVAVMRGHQRYFAVREKGGGKLLPRYLAVVNTALDPATILRGNDRVLRARLSDARFFVEEDRKKTLSDRLPKLDGIVFQAKLGTVGEKVRRVGELAGILSSDPEAARLAMLCKADLVSLIVGEFPELQGVMGRWYAQQEGLSARHADAIRDHYLPKGASDVVPSDTLAAHIAVADRLDTLVGCVGVGILPSGSADPFALRRAVLGVIRIALEGPIDVDAKVAFEAAHQRYVSQQKSVTGLAETLAKLDELLRGRLRSYLGERHAPDVVEACLAAWGGGSLRDLAARVDAVGGIRREPEFESLAVAFKRAHNIAKDAADGAIKEELFDHDAERALAQAFHAMVGRIEEATESGRYAQALRIVATELRGPIDRFFEQVFVMVDDAAVRENRLRLLARIARTLSRIAHFHLLSG
ncbi:MAG: glycine--tRNA ligase subunit beta [Sandaracinaceae bacterium]|nr:glycine--tRNA ligase subunit beta [Sandaracinaceae bacterium]